MRDKILKILTDIRPEYDFNDDVNFVQEGMLDSFDVLTLVTDLEENFNARIDGEDIVPENFESINAILALISKSKAD